VNGEDSAGHQTATWYAKEASGIYIYRFEAVSLSDPTKRFVDVKKMLMLK
jgi:hypothetical protein